MKNKPKIQTAAFAAGCFWGVEETFRKINGVIETEVGYMGGKLKNPTYPQVCMGDTGHAETVLVKYDPEEISYEELLNIFWSSHNPTTLNRQGPDVGSQYRSVIFYYNEEQKNAAQKSKDDLQVAGKFSDPIVTEIVPAADFYRAEEYHQKYLFKKGKDSCRI